MSRILIVEDDVVLARALKNWLERNRIVGVDEEE